MAPRAHLNKRLNTAQAKAALMGGTLICLNDDALGFEYVLSLGARTERHADIAAVEAVLAQWGRLAPLEAYSNGAGEFPLGQLITGAGV